MNKDLEFKCQEVEVESFGANLVNVRASYVDLDYIIEDITDEILNDIDIDDIIEFFGTSTLLDRIGIDSCIEYFDLDNNN